MYPSKPNVHDSSSGRSRCLISPPPGRRNTLGQNKSLSFCCVRTRLERPGVPGPHAAGVCTITSTPLTQDRPRVQPSELNTGSLLIMYKPLPHVWLGPCSPRHHGARPCGGATGCRVSVRRGCAGMEGQWSRTSQPGAPKAARCHGNGAPWASQARAGQ